jgi:dolichyl-phosphate-mannose-protein mannosyltransferase
MILVMSKSPPTKGVMPTVTRELGISEPQGELGTQPGSYAIVYFIISIGFLLRLIVAGSTFLDPDEAFHYVLGHAASFHLTYRASLSSMHPPLLILLIHSLRAVGNSEIILRLPSVLAGTLSCWLTYKWLSSITDFTVALIGLVLLAFSPPLFALESELRQYSLLLLFMSLALYLFEKALQENSASKMLLFSLALWVALASHYGALLFALSMGVYALLRFFELRPGIRLILPWSFGQALFLVLAVFFYKTHVPVVQEGISDSWLRKSFFHRGDHVIPFLFISTYRLFHFLLGQPVIGAIMFLLFVIGLVSMMRTEQKALRFRRAGWVVVFALTLSWVLSIAGIYPFGGTRQAVFLLPFIVLAVGSGLTNVLGHCARTAPLVATVAVTLCSLFPVPLGPHIPPPNQNILLMRQAINYVQHAGAPNQLVLIDQQTQGLFRYYFCPNDVFPLANPQNFICGRNRVHTSSFAGALSGEHLETDLRDTRRAFAGMPSESVFIFQTSWTVKMEPSLNEKFEAAGCTLGNRFGRNIIVCAMK